MSVTEFTADEQRALEEKWTLARFIYSPAGLITFGCLAFSWPSDHWAWQLLWTACSAYVLFCWTSCFHETAHQTLGGSKRASVALGRILGTGIGVPYTAYRETHIRHHAYLNKPTDWELWPYSDPNTSRLFRRVFVWFDLLFGSFTGAYIYGRIYFHKNSPIKSPAVRADIRREYIVIAVFWAGALAIVAYFDLWRMFLVAWVAPYLLAGIYQTVRKLTEHLGMSSYDPVLGTRTVVGSGPWTRFCTFMNFDIFVHGPHHRHPRVAHHQLKDKMEQFVTQHSGSELPVYSSYWRAIVSMLPSLLWNPGVGMNAGAAAPSPEKAVDVDNFVQDVTREILADADAATAPVSVAQ